MDKPKIISFEDFIKDYRAFYNETICIRIKDEEEMQEILYDLYDSDVFEIDYENQTITVY